MTKRSHPLRVFVSADSGPAARAVEGLGHELAVPGADGGAVDVALVTVDLDGETVLEQIRGLVDASACPVVLYTPAGESGLIAEAISAGIYAHTTTLEAVALRAAIDVAVSRFDTRAELASVMARRAVVDRAKGILMERYGLDENAAFQMLRRESRNANLKLLESAEIVTRGHRLLPKMPRAARRRRPGVSGALGVSLMGWMADDLLDAAAFLPSLVG
jgi:response regulator NasT